MKNVLFTILLALFVVTATITLLGVTKVIAIEEFYLKGLFGAFLIELGAAIFGMLRKSDLLEDDIHSCEQGTISQSVKSTAVPCPNVGNAPKKLTLEEERTLLVDLPNWDVVETKRENGDTIRELHRHYEFRTFEAAFDFMNKVVEQAVVICDHHPRWENTYSRVEVWLSTYDLDRQITNRDAELAGLFEQIWRDAGKGV